MVSLFENYEQQYSVLTADITAQIGFLSTSATSKLALLPHHYAYVNKIIFICFLRRPPPTYIGYRKAC